jgi:hypothetical protein
MASPIGRIAVDMAVTWPYCHGMATARLNVQHVGIPLVERDAPIRIAPGDMWVPHRFRASVRLGSPHNLTAELHIEMVEGARPSVIELTVTPHFGASAPVTSALLRSVPVEALTRVVIESVARPLTNLGGGAFVVAGDPPERSRSSPAPGGDTAHRAAGIYSGAVAAGAHNPTEVVAEQMRVSRSTASRYLREATNLGLLSPTRPGGRSTSKPKGPRK